MIGGRGVGIELTPTHVRAVRRGPLRAGAARTCELPWDPSRPQEAVDALRDSLGSASALALSVGLGFLQVKHVELPPVAPAERARALALEPERYFAEHDTPLVVALVAESSLAFAATGELVTGWIDAFEEWAPVVRVEPAPVSVARALGREANGSYPLEAVPGEVGSIEVRDGSLRGVRRMRSDDRRQTTDDRALPQVGGASGAFAAAIGALRGIDEPLAAMLVPEETAARLIARRRRSVAFSVVAVAAALFFVLWTAAGWRDRTLRALVAETSAAEARSGAAGTALRSLQSLESEGETIQRLATERPDPFGALAAIGGILPREAVVLSAKVTGDDWQLDGTARDASALVPLLDKDGRFENVHFLSASSRYREGSRTYETFSLALRHRPRP